MHWTTPLRRLQGRPGGVVIRRRSVDAQEDFHEKLIVACTPLEIADSDLLSLFWLTLGVELGPAPPREHDHHDRRQWSHTNTDCSVGWVQFLGDDDRERQEMVNLCDQAGLCLGNTWRNGNPTAFTPMSPSGSLAALLVGSCGNRDLLRTWHVAPALLTI